MPKYPDIKVYLTNRDGKIDDATYNAKRIELNETLDELHKKENMHRTADDNVNDAIINLFRAVQHISDNFIKSSEVASKRTILKSIFRTLQLKEKTLCYDLNFPFNVLYKNTENNNWRCGNNLRRTPYNKIQGLTGNFDGFGDHIFTHRAQFPRLLQKFTQK